MTEEGEHQQRQYEIVQELELRRRCDAVCEKQQYEKRMRSVLLLYIRTCYITHIQVRIYGLFFTCPVSLPMVGSWSDSGVGVVVRHPGRLKAKKTVRSWHRWTS